jgi:Holliday junction resolvase RusA-like endonuclease
MLLMYAFISNIRPCSVRAKTTERFKKAIRNAFKSYYPSTELLSNDLYGVVYYFHKKHNQLDADNLSKPIWDALEGILYEDDSIIKYRTAGIFDLRSSELEILDITLMPEQVASDFLERLDDSDHILYIEIGNLDYSLFKFGCENSGY